MSQEFFTNLPSHITINILSRLPIRTIVHCKCVCKSWLDLLKKREFINHHLSKSSPGLAVLQHKKTSKLYKIYNFKDEHSLEHHDLRYNLVTNFDLPFNGLIQGSANGLLFLRDLRPNGLFVCNPITREYIEIPWPQEFDEDYPQKVVTFGFGASRVTGQHKVVRVSNGLISDEETNKCRVTNSVCNVYTLETGSWRNIGAGDPFDHNCRSIGAFFKGNLHWLVTDLTDCCRKISCFDLETEAFSIVSVPPALSEQQGFLGDVFALGDCLCVSDNSSDKEIVIWLMKEYGVEKSWTKEFVIKKPLDDFWSDPYQVVYPIKVFKDGDILMAWGDFYLFYSPRNTRTITEIEMFEAIAWGAIECILHTSSFLSLKFFENEKLCTF